MGFLRGIESVESTVPFQRGLKKFCYIIIYGKKSFAVCFNDDMILQTK